MRIRQSYTLRLVCGHIRGSFFSKLGPGFYCCECGEKREAVEVIGTSKTLV